MSTRIMFLRDRYGNNKSNPVGCLAISLVRVNSALPVNDIHYQVSILNPSDRFNRAVARQLARGRLQEKPFLISNVPVKATMTDITEVVMEAVSNNDSIPKRARRAAAKWLTANTSDAVLLFTSPGGTSDE
jgi:hypothetical protein